MGFMSKLKGKPKKPHCIKCGLHLQCKNPRIKPSGLGKKNILIINNFLSLEDDEYRTHMNSEESSYFENILSNAGVNLHNDCWRMSLTACLPYVGGVSRTPNKKEIDCCFPNIQGVIKKLKPQKIVLLGKEVCEKFYKKRTSQSVTITKARGTRFYDSDYDCWVYPIQHPSEILYFSRDEIGQNFYQRDINYIVNSSSDFPHIPKIEEIKKLVKLITNFDSVVSFLRKLLKEKPYMAFDYETTGIKPYLKGHKIVSIGVATSAGEYVAFPFQHKIYTEEQQNKLTRLWGKILADSQIRGIVHNLNFEYAWSTILGGAEPKGIVNDTRTTAHVLDNRRGITPLKFQLFKRYGIGDYDKLSKKYISAPEGKIFNRMEEMPVQDLLLYNAIDALGTLWLYNDQKKELVRNQKKALNFFFQGQLALAQVHLNGMKMNTKYYEEQMKLNRAECDSIMKELLNSKEATLYKKVTGETISITSLDDLKILFYDDRCLGLSPTKVTDKGNASLDAEALSKVGTPFANKILKYRKIEKLGNTYLRNMIKETADDYMHPFFNLHIPVSYRSSSSGINFQNLPKRDAKSMNCIRSGIVPDDDYLLGEADFSGAEVTVSGVTHLDENFLNYLRDKSTDMHRDNACDLFKFSPEELNDPHFTPEQKKLAKKIRFYAKNMWTFAQFYGDWYGSCAPNLWENVVEVGLKTPQEITVKEHLSNHGISTYSEFESHCAHVEDKMWNERFPEYTQWKKDIVKSFLKNGFIETEFGFLLTMLMDKKQCQNLIIQGCLQEGSLVHTDKGHFPIEELEGELCNVWTGFRFAEAVGVCRGEWELADIELENGAIIKCDTRHQLKNEINKWVNFKDLKIGGYVALPATLYIKNPKTTEKEVYRYSKIKSITITGEKGKTYTMSVMDNLHQFCADGVVQKNTSFHLLLYTLIRVHKELKRRKMKTKVIGQIHDSLIAHIYGPEFKEYRRIVQAVIKSLPKKFPWLIIPIEIELEISKLGKCGGNFANMYEVPV